MRDAVAFKTCKTEWRGGRDCMIWCGFVSVGDFMCEWTLGCRKWGHVCIIACSGGVCMYMRVCVTVSIPPGQVLALEIGSVYPCLTDGGQLDAPMQSQPNLEHWHWVRVTFPIYPWLALPSGRAMPAITSPPPPHTIYRANSCQLPLSYQSDR